MLHSLARIDRRTLVLGSAIAAASRAFAGEVDRKFTPPPGDETADVKALIDGAADALARGFTASDVLADAAYLAAHPYPRFRELIRAHAPALETCIAAASEPGIRLDVEAVVMHGRTPVQGVEVYAYHTSAKGWYAAEAAHVQAESGDVKHARLFAYVLTDRDGRFRLRTIRPEGYPATDLPAHVHFHLRSRGDATLTGGGEIRFDDDPRMTPAWRARSAQEGCVVAKVETAGGPIQRVSVTLPIG